jgi:methionyl aminopeptidase
VNGQNGHSKEAVGASADDAADNDDSDDDEKEEEGAGDGAGSGGWYPILSYQWLFM